MIMLKKLMSVLRKNRKYVVVGALLVVCAVTVTVISVLNREDVAPVSGVSAVSDDNLRPEMVPVYLYFANEDLKGLETEVRYIPIQEATKSAANLATVIVNELIDGPSVQSELSSVIPEDSALLDTVRIDGDRAIVNLNESFVDNHPGGKVLEQLTIYSIVNSLTEIKDINSVLFMIEGEPREEYMGNYKFDNPFPRSISLLLDD
mgnify:CR=1 FL=1